MLQKGIDGVVDGIGVKKHAVPVEVLSDVCTTIGVGDNGNAVCLEVLFDVGRLDFRRINVKRDVFIRDEEIGRENRSTRDVSAAQIGEPRNVFKRAE